METAEARPLDDEAAIGARWARVERWLARHAPEALRTLRPGAARTAVQAAERTLGHPLPPAVRASYGRHDGCAQTIRGDGPAFLFGRDFLSLERAAQAWADYNALCGWHAREQWPEDPRAAYEATCWHPTLFPLTHDWGGNHHCVDLTGELSGRPGRIVAQWHDDPALIVLAESLGAWLDRFADDLDGGKFVYVAGFGLTDDPPDKL